MQRRQWRSRFFASFYFCRVHGSQPEIGGGNFLIQTEITKVFASHCRWYFHNVVLTDGLDEDRSQTLGQLRIVISGGGELSFTDFYDRRILATDYGLQRHYHLRSHDDWILGRIGF